MVFWIFGVHVCLVFDSGEGVFPRRRSRVLGCGKHCFFVEGFERFHTFFGGVCGETLVAGMDWVVLLGRTSRVGENEVHHAVT